MTEITSLVSQYGLPIVIVAVLLYMVLRGEIRFRYPR
jgi:hypothetical protein